MKNKSLYELRGKLFKVKEYQFGCRGEYLKYLNEIYLDFIDALIKEKKKNKDIKFTKLLTEEDRLAIKEDNKDFIFRDKCKSITNIASVGALVLLDIVEDDGRESLLNCLFLISFLIAFRSFLDFSRDGDMFDIFNYYTGDLYYGSVVEEIYCYEIMMAIVTKMEIDWKKDGTKPNKDLLLDFFNQITDSALKPLPCYKKSIDDTPF